MATLTGSRPVHIDSLCIPSHCHRLRTATSNGWTNASKRWPCASPHRQRRTGGGGTGCLRSGDRHWRPGSQTGRDSISSAATRMECCAASRRRVRPGGARYGWSSTSGSRRATSGNAIGSTWCSGVRHRNRGTIACRTHSAPCWRRSMALRLSPSRWGTSSRQRMTSRSCPERTAVALQHQQTESTVVNDARMEPAPEPCTPQGATRIHRIHEHRCGSPGARAGL